MISTFIGRESAHLLSASPPSYLHVRRFYSYPQEFFQFSVPFQSSRRLHRCFQLPYTEFAAIPSRFCCIAPHNFFGTLAAERACLVRRPILTQIICPKRFSFYPAYLLPGRRANTFHERYCSKSFAGQLAILADHRRQESRHGCYRRHSVWFRGWPLARQSAGFRGTR